MTKTEAKLIHNHANNAMRVLNGVEFVKAGLTPETLQLVCQRLEVARIEVQAIADAAAAELFK